MAAPPAPAELLKQLIRFDTTNLPGDEADCIGYIRDLLDEAGIPVLVLARDPRRPNLVARVTGSGALPPLLLYGHVDVVTTENQQWQHPPFEGVEHDGFIWGRGALDMKGGVAQMISAVLRAKAAGVTLPRDVVLAIVGDEEAGGVHGARFLVEQHAEHFQGIRHAIGEFGGFTLNIGGKRFYPIMVAEKQICTLRATVRGPAGHGSMPVRGGAMLQLSHLLRRLDQHRLPVHITPPARMMFEAVSAGVGGATGALLRQLLNPLFTDRVLDSMGPRARMFDALLHNTVSPTMLRGSSKINVIPAEVSVDMDGRLLPGLDPQDMLAEVRRIAGPGVEVELVSYEPGPAAPDMSLFDALAAILREADPSGTPVPLLLSGVTDGRFFSRLGIQTYGYLPMPLPDDFNFSATIHAADERVPVSAIEFGTNVIYQALLRA